MKHFKHLIYILSLILFCFILFGCDDDTVIDLNDLSETYVYTDRNMTDNETETAAVTTQPETSSITAETTVVISTMAAPPETTFPPEENSLPVTEEYVPTEAAAPSASDAIVYDTQTESDYVLNTNTKKFHLPTCSSVTQMKSKNRKDVHAARETIIEQGYEPCKNCNP